MILQSLFHLYNELCKQGKVPQEGWGMAKVTHRIILDGSGHLIGIISAKKTVSRKTKRGEKEVEVPAEMNVPLPIIRTSTSIRPNFLCDSPSYILGIDNKGKPERARKCFEASRAYHHEILDTCNSPTARAILGFFDNWHPDTATDNPILHDDLDDILSASNFIFNVDGTDVLEDESIREAWNNYHGQIAEEDGPLGPCLVTGKDNQKIAILHPKIKGVMDTQSGGANLVSFNKDSFCSYGHDKEQGINAPVSKQAAFAYGTALNYLLSDKEHVKILGDTTVVYWSEHALTVCQDCMNYSLNADGSMTDKNLKAIVSHMKDGLPVDLDGIRINPEEPFYILGLAPNAARISIRFFLRNSFGKTISHIIRHQARMRLLHPPREHDYIALWQTLEAASNPNSDKPQISSYLMSSFLKSVITDTPYPAALYQTILRRVFSDYDHPGTPTKRAIQKVNYTKAAFIKAYLLKNYSKNWEGK
ncbi:type I-C CRISPR-associated protein Cas8c/Csd1, partial [Dialister sp.]|uniref:type I-C CRISPR-associated protein Cas8c/Csd1 n=1 Tax=Dialister sp. TaxID=1955814 RepID=UPI003EFFAD8E